MAFSLLINSLQLKSVTLGAAAALAAILANLSSSAHAAPPARANACSNPSQSLGVSRIVEVDTSAGPLFGHQQYKEQEFLAKGEVVLTFDDGPLRPYTQPVVDALEAQCTKATFFMVGSQAVADPDMVKQIMRKGHTVGTHTWSHANMRKQTPLNARREIELGFSAVAQAAGQPIAPFFRFPFLADTKAMLGYSQTRQFGVFSIDIDSLDYKSKSAEAVHQEILSHLAAQGKGILLFHDIQPATAQALPGLLEALRQKGYRVVHLKSKAVASTLPEFDAMARDQNARRQVTAASNSVSNRAVTFGAGAPASVVAGAAGTAVATARLTQPRIAATGPGTGPGLPPQGVPAGVFTGPGNQRPNGYPIQPGAGIPAPVPQVSGVGDPAQQAPRVARQKPTDDWRTSIFSR